MGNGANAVANAGRSVRLIRTLTRSGGASSLGAFCLSTPPCPPPFSSVATSSTPPHPPSPSTVLLSQGASPTDSDPSVLAAVPSNRAHVAPARQRRDSVNSDPDQVQPFSVAALFDAHFVQRARRSNPNGTRDKQVKPASRQSP